MTLQNGANSAGLPNMFGRPALGQAASPLGTIGNKPQPASPTTAMPPAAGNTAQPRLNVTAGVQATPMQQIAQGRAPVAKGATLGAKVAADYQVPGSLGSYSSTSFSPEAYGQRGEPTQQPRSERHKEPKSGDNEKMSSVAYNLGYDLGLSSLHSGQRR